MNQRVLAMSAGHRLAIYIKPTYFSFLSKLRGQGQKRTQQEPCANSALWAMWLIRTAVPLKPVFSTNKGIFKKMHHILHSYHTSVSKATKSPGTYLLEQDRVSLQLIKVRGAVS